MDSKEGHKTGPMYKISYIPSEIRSTLDLPSLKYRRLQGDMITVYNIFHRNFDLDVNEFFFSPTCIIPPEATPSRYLNSIYFMMYKLTQ